MERFDPKPLGHACFMAASSHQCMNINVTFLSQTNQKQEWAGVVISTCAETLLAFIYSLSHTQIPMLRANANGRLAYRHFIYVCMVFFKPDLICSAEPPDVALVIAHAASFFVRNSAT